MRNAGTRHATSLHSMFLALFFVLCGPAYRRQAKGDLKPSFRRVWEVDNNANNFSTLKLYLYTDAARHVPTLLNP